MRDTMQRLSARPHHVGSPYDKDNAEWILAKFKGWGFDAKWTENRDTLTMDVVLTFVPPPQG